MNVKREILEILELCMETDKVSADISAATPNVAVHIFKNGGIMKTFNLCIDNNSVIFKEKDILECKGYIKQLLKSEANIIL